MTPIVVRPETFDLSFLYFAASQADDQHPHMDFGFAPFSDRISQPYLYAYASPMPDGFERLPLPPGAQWHVEGWRRMVYPYDDLVGARIRTQRSRQSLRPSIRHSPLHSVGEGEHEISWRKS